MSRYGGVRPGTNTNKKVGILSYPTNVGTGNEYQHSIEFTARKRNLSSPNQSSSSSLGSVVLYLPPDALKTSYSQTFGDTDLGAVGIGLAGVSSFLCSTHLVKFLFASIVFLRSVVPKSRDVSPNPLIILLNLMPLIK